jgi:hypothetical protein
MNEEGPDVRKRVEMWPHVAMRLVKMPAGFLVPLLTSGGAFVTKFDEAGRYVEQESVWWDENRHASFLETDLASGLVALGLRSEEADALASELHDQAEPLSHSTSHAQSASSSGRSSFVAVFAGWLVAFGLLIALLIVLLT